MVSTKTNIVPTQVYNALPHISDVAGVPKNDAADLLTLRALLDKHKLPNTVAIRLIHKHFDIRDNEAMAFKDVIAEPYGTVTVMRPTTVIPTSDLHGLNYFVDSAGDLQAYEYVSGATTDLSTYPAFIAEFSAIVTQRGLQRKFGLTTKSNWGVRKWSEFEYPCQRSTMIIPEGLPTPEDEGGFTVATEWGALSSMGEPQECNAHSITCNRHCRGHCKVHCNDHGSYDAEKGSWYLGGRELVAGTSVHGLVAAVIETW